MAPTETIDAQAVDAEINYIWNPRSPQDETLTFVTEAEEESTMRTLPGRTVRIANARSLHWTSIARDSCWFPTRVRSLTSI